MLIPMRFLLRLLPWRRRKKKELLPKKVIAGVIIGGAIASIIGKTLLDKHRSEHGDDVKDEE
jgi:uncharacterized membrane protein